MRRWLTVAGVVLLVGGCGSAADRSADNGGDNAPADSATDESEQGVGLPHTDIPPERFRAEWNDVVAAYGYGPTLDPREQDDGEQVGLLLDEPRIGEWLRVTVSTHLSGPVAQSHVHASPRSADEVGQALAGAAAMISASSSLDPTDAEQLVTDTVGRAETMGQGNELLEDVERDGKRYSFTVTPQNPVGEVVAHLSFAMIPLGD